MPDVQLWQRFAEQNRLQHIVTGRNDCYEPKERKKGRKNVDRLKNKIVLVTGAAGAIGSAITAAVAAQGGTAIKSDLAGRADIDHGLDVTSEADWTRAIGEIERGHGRLDGLVNAAGIIAVGTVEDTELATWRRVMAINSDG